MKKNVNTGIYLVLGIALLMASPVCAADVLTWDDCVKSALANNPALIAKRKAVEQSEYAYKDALNNYLPKIGLSHGYSLGGPQFSGGGRGSWSASVSANETLWSAANNSSYRSAKLTYEQSKISYDSESAALRKNLYSKFLNLLVEQEQSKVNDKVLQIRKENANLTKLKYDSGRESLGNMKYAKAQYTQALASKHKSDRSLEASRRDLLVAMGEDSYRDIVVKAELQVPDKTFTDEQLQEALDNSPAMKLQKMSIAKAKESVKSSESSLYPSLGASGSLNWSGDSEFPNDSKRWSFGLSLSLPLFSGGITHLRNSIKSAKAGVLIAEENYRNAKMELESNLRVAHANLINACETVEAGQLLLEANEERYNESRIMYLAGAMSFIDFENVEQNLVNAQISQLEYLSDANAKKITLENLLGVTLEK